MIEGEFGRGNQRGVVLLSTQFQRVFEAGNRRGGLSLVEEALAEVLKCEIAEIAGRSHTRLSEREAKEVFRSLEGVTAAVRLAEPDQRPYARPVITQLLGKSYRAFEGNNGLVDSTAYAIRVSKITKQTDFGAPVSFTPGPANRIDCLHDRTLNQPVV